ncbi:MAG: c-type cytochrome domain-containing protein, partial [Planctomycetota bacterium]
MLRSLWLAIHLAIGLCSCAFFDSVAQESSPEQLDFFEKEIRPTLAQPCFPCHGPEKQKADLRLDSLPGILQGGESGPAVVPGDSKNSLMAAAIRYESLQMPPTGKLPQHKINAILQWIDAKTPAP